VLAAAAAADGGVLTYALYQAINDSLDPHVTNGTVDAVVYAQALDPLIWKIPTGYAPGLAESWSVSSDSSEYTFHLRKGVVFQDGTSFNAQAVKATFDRIVNPQTKSRIALGFMGSYTATEITDDYTVRVKFAKPYAAFLDGASQVFLGIASPTAMQKWGADFGSHLIGTGPFTLQEYVSGQRVVLVRNPRYNWGPNFFTRPGPANLDRIVFTMLVEDVARVGALERGEVQAIEKTPTDDIPRLKQEGFRVELQLQPGMPISLVMNTARPPLDDIHVRQALEYAVSQTELVNTLFSGVNRPAKGPMSSATWGYNEQVQTMYPYDPSRAKALLDGAGWTMGPGGLRAKNGTSLRLQLIYLTGTGFDETWQLVQAQLRRVGIDAVLNGMAAGAALEKATAGDFDLIHLRWSFSDPDTLSVMWSSRNVGGGTGFNFSKAKNPVLDQLLDGGAAERDLKKRQDIYDRVQTTIMQQAYLIPIYDEGNPVAMAPKVVGMQFDPRGRAPLLHDVTLSK